MVNLFELAAKITLDKKDFDNGLKDGESRLSRFGSGVNKALKASVAISGAAVAAGAAAFAKITKSALNAVGDLEQGLGGSEAVFGDWAGFIKDQANSAAESMGLSATEYLATANKMGSLLQGVGYSQMDAADLASDAMQRAADVASIMDIDVSAAMESITGAMKGNFTMMDNLGVAINDTTLKAYAASKGMSKAAIDNLSTQQKVGLALELFMEKSEYAMGNYAKENDTLAGSMTTLKAAWNNFLSGAGGENAPAVLGNAIDRTADIVVKNIGEIVPRLSSGLSKVMKTVGGKLPGLMKTLMPGIETGATALLDMLGDALPYIIETGVNLIPSVVSGMGKLFVKVGQKAPEMLKSLGNGLKNAGKQIGGMIFGMDGENVKWPTWDDVKGYAAVAWEGIKNGVAALGGLIFGKNEDGSVKWPTWADVKAAAKVAWDKIKSAAISLGTEFGKIIFGTDENGDVKWPTPEEIREKATEWWNNTAKPAIDSVTNWVLKIFENPEETVESIKQKVSEWWEGNHIGEALSSALDWTLRLFGVPEETGDSIKTVISGWWENVKSYAESAISWLISLPTMPDPNTAGKELRKVISNWWKTIKSTLSGIATLLFGIGGPEDKDGSKTKEAIVAWWDEKVVPILEGALDFVLGLFDLPSVSEMVQKIENWWSDVKADVGELILSIVPKLFGQSIEESLGADDIREGEDWGDALTRQYREWGFPVIDPSTVQNLDDEHAKGLGYVPFNGYRALLHRGEMVLNRSRADEYRNGKNSGGIDLRALTAAVSAAVRNGMAGVAFNLDGQKVVQNTSERQAADEMAWRFAIG